MVRLIPTLLEYLLAAATYSVTVKNAAGCISALTSVTINAQPDKTRSITVDPVCNTDRTLTIDLNHTTSRNL
jgi:hypothetical protein